MSPFWLSAGTASLHHVQPGSPDNWNPRQVVACQNPVNPTENHSDLGWRAFCARKLGVFCPIWS